MLDQLKRASDAILEVVDSAEAKRDRLCRAGDWDEVHCLEIHIDRLNAMKDDLACIEAAHSLN